MNMHPHRQIIFRAPNSIPLFAAAIDFYGVQLSFNGFSYQLCREWFIFSCIFETMYFKFKRIKFLLFRLRRPFAWNHSMWLFSPSNQKKKNPNPLNFIQYTCFYIKCFFLLSTEYNFFYCFKKKCSTYLFLTIAYGHFLPHLLRFFR